MELTESLEMLLCGRAFTVTLCLNLVETVLTVSVNKVCHIRTI